MTPLARRLAEYAHGLGFADLPAAVVHEAKRRVIDSLGCAFGAYHEPPVAIARALALTVDSRQGATVLGTTHKTAADLAAFVAGAMIRFLDYNDTYLALEPAHPSDNLSAVLAAAETAGAGGRELITALVLGYEVQCRMCDAASLRRRGWDHVTYGPISTALAAGKLLGLDVERLTHAVNLAGTPNTALRQTRVGELSMWKGLAFANAARNGLFAALLARGGMTGPAPLFEGEKGFFNLVSGPFELARLGGGAQPFKIRDTYIKYYPAEYHAQSAIEAALRLRGSVTPPLIQAIEVRTFDVSVEIIGKDPEKWTPQSRETADHSLPYLVAVALADGGVGTAQFTPQRIADPALRALVRKVTVVEEPAFSAVYPRSMPNEVVVQLTDGRVESAKVMVPKGHPQRPLTDAEVEQKFRALAQPVLGAAAAKRLLEQLWRLEEVTAMEQVLERCRVPAGTES